jgi:hypothetical protein
VDLRDYCRRVGFDTVATTEHGIVDVNNADPFCLKRVLPPPPLHFFACEIARYFIFARN